MGCSDSFLCSLQACFANTNYCPCVHAYIKIYIYIYICICICIHAYTHTYAYMHIHVCIYGMSSHVFPCSHHADFQGSAKDTPYQQPEQIHIALGQPGVGCRDRCISRRENHLYMVDIPANHVWLPEDLRIGMPYLYIFNLLTLIVGSISWPFTSRGSNAIWSQCGLGIHCFNLFGPVSGKCCAFLLEAKSTQRKSCMQFKPCCAVSGKKKHQYLTHSVSESCQTTAAYIHGLFLHFMRFEISKAMFITSVFAFNKQKICDKTVKNIVCCCFGAVTVKSCLYTSAFQHPKYARHIYL